MCPPATAGNRQRTCDRTGCCRPSRRPRPPAAARRLSGVVADGMLGLLDGFPLGTHSVSQTLIIETLRHVADLACRQRDMKPAPQPPIRLGSTAKGLFVTAANPVLLLNGPRLGKQPVEPFDLHAHPFIVAIHACKGLGRPKPQAPFRHFADALRPMFPKNLA